MMLPIMHHAWLINTVSVSEKSALWAAVNYADASHIKGNKLCVLETSSPPEAAIFPAGITGLAVQVMHGPAAAAQVNRAWMTPWLILRT